MAGHSKWANIKFRKSGQDAKRGKLFTKLIREITVAARSGGPEAGNNPRLRRAIDAALAANMSKDTIERAVKKGAGTDAADDLAEVRYEGYAVGGVAVIVDCLTDNKNRTVGEIRHAFTKHGGSLGVAGSVAYLFAKRGVLILTKPDDSDAAMEVAIDAGAIDIEVLDDGSLEVLVDFADLNEIETKLVAAGLKITSSETAMLAETNVAIVGDDVEKINKLIIALEDLDDVQEVYTNIAS